MLPAIHGLLRWIFVINIFRQGSRYSIAYNANLYIQECLTCFPSVCFVFLYHCTPPFYHTLTMMYSAQGYTLYISNTSMVDIRGGVAQWLAHLPCNTWMPVRYEF